MLREPLPPLLQGCLLSKTQEAKKRTKRQDRTVQFETHRKCRLASHSEQMAVDKESLIHDLGY